MAGKIWYAIYSFDKKKNDWIYEKVANTLKEARTKAKWVQDNYHVSVKIQKEQVVQIYLYRK